MFYLSDVYREHTVRQFLSVMYFYSSCLGYTAFWMEFCTFINSGKLSAVLILYTLSLELSLGIFSDMPTSHLLCIVLTLFNLHFWDFFFKMSTHFWKSDLACRLRGIGSGTGLLVFKPQLCHSLLVWPWKFVQPMHQFI